MPKRATRSITWAILPILLWTFAGGPGYVAHAQDRQSRDAAREQSLRAQPRNFDDVVLELRTSLEAVRDGDDRALDIAKALRNEIRTRDEALRQEFAEVEAMILDEGLPPEILQRHRDFVAEYDSRLAAVETGLNQVEKGAPTPDGIFERAWFNTKNWFTGDPVRENAAGDTVELLESYRPQRTERSSSPNDLPFRRLTPQRDLKPKETEAEWEKTLSPDTDASFTAQALGALRDTIISPALAQGSDLPEPDDLSETADVQFTPEIVALAGELNNNPVDIYNWVREEIRFSPVWGSIQGAQKCLQTRICNSIDAASLLIALLRSAGIPASYKFGTVEAHEAAFRSWLGGFTSLEAAASHLASAGVPNIVRRLNEDTGLRTVVFEHVWVVAYVDFIPSQGAKNEIADTWVALDPSWRLTLPNEPSDLAQYSGLNDPLIFDAVFPPDLVSENPRLLLGIDPAPLDNASLDSDAAQAFLESSIPEKTYREASGANSTVVSSLDLLPANLPYDVHSSATRVSSIPATFKHNIRIDVMDKIGNTVISYTSNTSAISSNMIVLSYELTSSNESAYLISLIPDEFITPFPEQWNATLIRVRPVLRVDGDVVARGPIMDFGERHEYRIAFGSPNVSSTPVVNEILAGETQVMVLDGPGGVESTWAYLKDDAADRIAALDIDYKNFSPSEMLQSELGTAAATWLSLSNLTTNTISSQFGLVTNRYPSLAVAYADWEVVEGIFGIPWQASFSGIGMDIDRDVVVSASKDSDQTKLVLGGITSGVLGSQLEVIVPRILYSEGPTPPAWIATSGINEVALSLSVPVAVTLKDGLDDLLGTGILSGLAATEIAEATNDGSLVIAPTRELLQRGTKRFFGYFKLNLENGSGSYIVNAAGGSEILKEAGEANEQIQRVVSLAFGLEEFEWDVVSEKVAEKAFTLFLSKMGGKAFDELVGATKGAQGIINEVNHIIDNATEKERYYDEQISKCRADGVIGCEALAGLLALIGGLEFVAGRLPGQLGEVAGQYVSIVGGVALRGYQNEMEYFARLRKGEIIAGTAQRYDWAAP